MNPNDQNWFATSRGEQPRLAWVHSLNAPLAALDFCRESGQVVVADERGGLYLIERSGDLGAVARSSESFRKIAWSDDGSRGFALSGDHHLHWIRPDLSVRATIELPEPSLAVASEAFGQYAAVSLANGVTLIFDGPRQPLRHFSSTRPLTHLAFLAQEAGLTAVADYGLVCRFDFFGRLNWQTNTFSSVGDFAVAGDGDSLLVAGFGQGLLRFDSDGNSIGAYQLGSTVAKVASSFSGVRAAAASQEQELFWLGKGGQILWTGKVRQMPLFIACDPWGTALICALPDGLVARLEWSMPD